MYQKFTEASTAHQAAQEELAELEKKQAQIEASVANLSSERGIEAEIRNRFGVAREGEGEIKIVRDEEAEEPGELQKKSLWQRIISAFAIW
jgi:cell division protein FtsB